MIYPPSKQLGIVSSYAFGFTLPFRAGMLILKKPKLWLWAFLPLLLAGTLYYFGFSAAMVGVKKWIATLTQSWGLASGSWVSLGVMGIVNLALVLIGAFLFSPLSMMIASPLNDFLAETAEQYAEPPLPHVANYKWTFKIRLVWIDLAKAIASTTASVFALLVSWVPGLNVFSLTLAFLLMSFQYTSYPQTRRGETLKDGLTFLMKHFFANLGFGMALSLLFSIPLLSITILPLAVVGGTLLVARAQNQCLR